MSQHLHLGQAVSLHAIHRFVLPLLFLALLSVDDRAATADWPEFRGPWGNGHAQPPGDSEPVGLPLYWSETSNVVWKAEIPHHGLSAPVVMGGQVWLTTATVEGHDSFAICLDAESGRILLNERVFHTDNPEPLGNGASMNSYATPSALIEAGRVYVHFGSAGTACLDTSTRKVIWRRDDLPCRHYRGPSSSPVSYEDLLILTMDGADLQYHVALNKNSGETVWKTDRSVEWNDGELPGRMAKEGDLRKAHSTPLIAATANGPQLISAGAKAAYGYDPRTGRELWRVQYDDWSVAPRPLFDNGLAYIVTGFTKKEMWAVKTDGEGDVTDTAVVWKLKSRVGKYASPLLVNGLIYTAAAESFVSCIDAETGEAVWTERIGGKYAASPVYADGRLYFFSQEGKTTVLQPGRNFEALATNKLDAGFMASPAVSGRALYLRTKTHLYRIETETADRK
jgi:outer membrane protein assembly factor BamB